MRRIWWFFGIGGVILFVIMSSTVFGLYMAGNDWDPIVTISTAIFQIVVLAYGMGFVLPYFLTFIMKFNVTMDMSQKSLDIGNQTAERLCRMQEEVMPVVEDAKELSVEVRKLIEDVKSVIEHFKSGNGHLTKTAEKVVVEARKALKTAETELERVVWSKVDQFLGEAFGVEGDGQPEKSEEGTGEEAHYPAGGGEGK